jgi:hypothetical protein
LGMFLIEIIIFMEMSIRIEIDWVHTSWRPAPGAQRAGPGADLP